MALAIAIEAETGVACGRIVGADSAGPALSLAVNEHAYSVSQARDDGLCGGGHCQKKFVSPLRLSLAQSPGLTRVFRLPLLSENSSRILALDKL